MVFLVLRIIIISTLLFSAFQINDGFFNLLYHTFIKYFLCIILLYGSMLSSSQEKKAWGWIFGILAFIFFVYACNNIKVSFLGSPDYLYLLTALLLFISLFKVKDETNELSDYLVINKSFYLLVVLFIVLNLSFAGYNYRWKEIDDLGFSINDHCYVICNDFDSVCDDLRDCGWKYYQDKLTGLSKAVQDEYDPPLIIYEDETKLSRIEYVLSIGLFIIMISTLGAFYYHINSTHRD